MLWEHEPQASVSTALSSSPKLSRVSLIAVFFISFRKHGDEKKEKQLVNFDYENVNSLCSRHHYITARASSMSPSSYTNTIFNQSARVLS